MRDYRTLNNRPRKRKSKKLRNGGYYIPRCQCWECRPGRWIDKRWSVLEDMAELETREELYD